MKHENPQLTFMTFLELATKYHKCIQNKYEIKKTSTSNANDQVD